jgi:hypothetical protein
MQFTMLLTVVWLCCLLMMQDIKRADWKSSASNAYVFGGGCKTLAAVRLRSRLKLAATHASAQLCSWLDKWIKVVLSTRISLQTWLQ